MYTVSGNCTPLGRQTIEDFVRPNKLEVTFCYLGIHALSSRWLWTFNHNTCENAWKKFKELLPVLSSHHLSFKTRDCVYSSCVRSAMLHAILAIDKAKPPTSAVEWWGNYQTDLQCQVARRHHQTYWALRGLALRIWTSFWRREGVRVFLGLNHLDHWTWTGPSDYQLDQMGCISWTNSSWTKS